MPCASSRAWHVWTRNGNVCCTWLRWEWPTKRREPLWKAGTESAAVRRASSEGWSRPTSERTPSTTVARLYLIIKTNISLMLVLGLPIYHIAISLPPPLFLPLPLSLFSLSFLLLSHPFPFFPSSTPISFIRNVLQTQKWQLINMS